MHKHLLAAVLSLAVAMTGASALEAHAKTTFVTIGTGGITGVYYPTGGAIASKSQLSFSDPVATVSAKDKKGTIAISQLHISGTTSIQLIPMGCIVGSNNLSFSMGSINASEFNTATKVARGSL